MMIMFIKRENIFQSKSEWFQLALMNSIQVRIQNI